MKLFILILLFNLDLQKANAKDCKHDKKTFKCVEYLKNYDADTITFNIKGTHPIIGEKISIRVLGVDAPEIRTKNTCEKKLAVKAKLFVKDLLEKASTINLTNISRGKYFRIVAGVEIDGINLSKLLIEKGYAYPYDGGKKSQIDWCEVSHGK